MNTRTGTEQPFSAGGIPRPGKALIGVMVTLLTIWIVFAVGVNWGGAEDGIFRLLVGSTRKVLHGQLWRLLTAPLLHVFSGDFAVSHIVTTLLGLFFLAPSLERKWGGRRLVAFLYGAAIAGFITQLAVEALLPASVGSRVRQDTWFGAVGAVEAVAIAWALSFRGQRVMLMFVLPVSSSMLVIFVIGVSLLRLMAVGTIPEGLFSPFGSMLFGWLVGGGEPAPIRRWWLQRRLKKLQQMKKSHTVTRIGAPKLRVIEGSRSTSQQESPPDKRWLN